MKSFDRNSFEEQTRLVSRYVAGDLSRSERAEFETWLIATPELAEEVEMERRLRAATIQGCRAIVVRAGDFFGPKLGNSWFSQGLVKPGQAVKAVSLRATSGR